MNQGLTGYGVYVPRHFISRSEIARALGGSGAPGARAVASYDEDTTSMGVEAARVALRNAPRPDRLLFATTEPAYADKTNATLIHAALGLDPSSLAVDMVGSVRSGIGAVLLAIDSSTPTLVVLSDTRTGLPGGADEREGGDAAAALVFGGDGAVIANVLGYGSATDEFLERWRLPGAISSRVWEERFGEHVYLPLADAALTAAVNAAGVAPSDIDVLLVAGTQGRAVKAFASAAGGPGAVDDLVSSIGNSGAAHAGVLLADALDRAAPNRTIALVVLADGASALVLRTTEALATLRPRQPVRAQTGTGDDSLRYTTFLTWRGYLDREPARRPDPIGPAAPPSRRSTGYKHGFVGSTCAGCGTLHLPAVRVCVRCKELDRMTPTPMSDAQGRIVTYTVDRLAHSPSPPVVAAVVDFDGGGRFSCELADVDPANVAVGDRVEMTFRRLVTSGGVHNYFWKARKI